MEFLKRFIEIINFDYIKNLIEYENKTGFPKNRDAIWLNTLFTILAFLIFMNLDIIGIAIMIAIFNIIYYMSNKE